MGAFDEVKSRIDIVNYINSQVPLTKAGKIYNACCPFHSEKTPSFTVFPDTQTWHCFGSCKEGGDVFDFYQRHNNCDSSVALVELAKYAGVELEYHKPKVDESVYKLLDDACNFYHTMLRKEKIAEDARKYLLEKRSLTKATLTAHRIGYAPESWDDIVVHLKGKGYSDEMIIYSGLAAPSPKSGKPYNLFRNRIIFPICDSDGRVVGFSGRAMSQDQKAKYYNTQASDVFNKGSLLYLWHIAKGNAQDGVVLVEGYMDALQAHQSGFNNVVAQMGTALTKEQCNLILRKTNKVIVALDGDKAGQSSVSRDVEVFVSLIKHSERMSLDIRYLALPNEVDPDDLIKANPDQWREMVAKAPEVQKFLIDTACVGITPESPITDKHAVYRKLKPILNSLETDFYKQSNLRYLALKLQVPEESLLKKLTTNQAQPLVHTNYGSIQLCVLKFAMNRIDEFVEVNRFLRTFNLPILSSDDFDIHLAPVYSKWRECLAEPTNDDEKRSAMRSFDPAIYDAIDREPILSFNSIQDSVLRLKRNKLELANKALVGKVDRLQEFQDNANQIALILSISRD